MIVLYESRSGAIYRKRQSEKDREIIAFEYEGRYYFIAYVSDWIYIQKD
jgi:hypothetical protein